MALTSTHLFLENLFSVNLTRPPKSITFAELQPILAPVAEPGIFCVVQLRPENILELARDVIKLGGWQCEWVAGPSQKPSMCRQMLASWNAYLKHLLWHGQEHCKNSKPPFTCLLPRCNVPPSMTSFNELARHIQLTHLSRSQLSCPVNGCDSSTFSRPGMLEDHFSDCHSDLLNKTIHLPSQSFLPSWKPFPPPNINPPPLPEQVPPGSVLVPPVKGSWKSRPHTPQRFEAVLSGTPKQKQHGPQIPSTKSEVEPEGERAEIVFDDLPKQLDDNGNYIWDAKRECIIQSLGPSIDVARPQPLLDPSIFGNMMLPKSILYDAFIELHVAELGADEDEKVENDLQVPISIPND